MVDCVAFPAVGLAVNPAAY